MSGVMLLSDEAAYGQLNSYWSFGEAGVALGPLDIGPGATNRANTNVADFTMIDTANPANVDGEITSVELWFNTSATGVKVGTFEYISGTSFDLRDSETLGAVTAGSKQTFSGLNIACVSGDYIGIYFATGLIDWSASGGSGVYYLAGDQFGAGSQSYTISADTAFSIYGIGIGN